jgi:hypothetical protein
MSVARINGIYIPGWEFNRVLSDEPWEARNSALPGALLWAGAGVFWMFEKVYCTKEAYENEACAAEELEWATSSAFCELADRRPPGGDGPIIEPVDWATGLDQNAMRDLKRVHVSLKSHYPGRRVRELIDAGKDRELELINYAILEPIAVAKQSLVAAKMSGLCHWIAPSPSGEAVLPRSMPVEAMEFLSRLSRPIEEYRRPNGIRLMNPPWEWNPEAADRQRIVEEELQAPWIKALMAGEDEFVGAEGYRPYFRKIRPGIPVYKEIDEPLHDCWKHSKQTLFRLREVASRFLWDELHGTWLPALVLGDPDAVRDFPRWIDDALANRRFAGLLNITARQAFGTITALLSAVAKFFPPASSFFEYAALGSGVAYARLEDRRGPIAKNAGPLAIFYDEAFKTLRQ